MTTDLPEVLLLDDVARLLRTSPRTIRRQMVAGTFPLAPLPWSVDRKTRWSREVVLAALRTGVVSRQAWRKTA